jgi:threonine/homoserine/homoserine lactone efflux protein
MFEAIILPAISLGLSATSIPGPLQAYLLNISVRYGWRRGVIVIFSPLVTDGPVILVTVFLLGQLPPPVIQAIRVVGGLLLLFIAWGAYQQLRQGVTFSADSAADPDHPQATIAPWRVLGTASAMNLLSPGPYLFWATVNGPLLLQALEIGTVAALGMLLGFYGTFLGGMALLVLVFDRLGQIDVRVTQMILLLTIALLVWFGTGLIATAFNLQALHRLFTLLIIIVTLVQGWRMYRQHA